MTWYPNKAQWRMIWVIALGWTAFTVVIAAWGPALLALLIDGLLYIWKLQKTGDSN